MADLGGAAEGKPGGLAAKRAACGMGKTARLPQNRLLPLVFAPLRLTRGPKINVIIYYNMIIVIVITGKQL